MSRTIRVAALQLRAHDREDFARALAAIAAIARSAAQDADLVVLPEATFPAYVLGDARVDDAAIGGALDLLREIALETRTVVVAGAALRDPRGLRNAAVVIDADGSIAGSADKIFLWHFDRLWFEAGQRIARVGRPWRRCARDADRLGHERP
jgi:predicted amidohydrolase